MLINGKKIAEKIEKDLKNKIGKKGLKLRLVVILIGNDKASEKYIKIKEKACHEVGIGFCLVKFKGNTQPQDIIKKIKELNDDNQVTGIVVQLPLPKNYVPNEVLESINPSKDVDGLHSQNLGKLIKKIDTIYPATAEGVMILLKHYKIKLKSKNIVVIGQSNLVGKPLAQMLLNENGTVTVINRDTKNIEDITLKSDIVISAAGSPKLIKGKMIKKGATVIDIGTTVKNGKIIGDVDFESVKKIAGAITPNPGGVGPITVAVLLANVVKAYNLRKELHG